MTVTGGSALQVIDHGIVARVLPAFPGVSAFRRDIDIRESAILGLAGAGGLGRRLQASPNVPAWPQVTLIFIVILAILAVSERVSAKVRHAIV